MNVIRPNCRIQFTADDIDFIVQTLGSKVGSAECLVQLLADQDSRDLILDDDLLFRAVLERCDCLRVSPRLYFYVLVRQVFRGSAIEEREVADYVAEVLAAFSQQERTRLRLHGKDQPADYFFEMLAALESADDAHRFYIRAHVGNASLFLTGVFPDRIRFRAERHGAPSMRYYEDLGRASYRVARDHRLARKYDLAGVFDALSEHFQATRHALNELNDRLLHLGDAGVNLKCLGAAPD